MRNWWCRRFHRLGWPIYDYFPCECGRRVPIRHGLADILIFNNRRERLANDIARAMRETNELERLYGGQR